MTSAAFWSAWQLWMGVGVVIVLAAAALLIAIWWTARGILHEAVRALRAAEVIRAQTEVVLALDTSNDVAGQLLSVVQELERKGGALVEAVSAGHANAERR